jgi:hypothetical protein
MLSHRERVPGHVRVAVATQNDLPSPLHRISHRPHDFQAVASAPFLANSLTAPASMSVSYTP